MSDNKKTDLLSLLRSEDYYGLLNYSLDTEQELVEAWYSKPIEDFRIKLKKAFQEYLYAKGTVSEIEYSISFALGKIEGIINTYSVLLQEEEGKNAIIKETAANSEKARQILRALYNVGNNGIRHGELADMVGTSDSSLTNIMKRMLRSGAVEAARTGKNTFYKLSSTGKHFWEQSEKENERLMRNDKEIAQMLELTKTLQELVPALQDVIELQKSNVTINPGDALLIPKGNGFNEHYNVDCALKEANTIYMSPSGDPILERIGTSNINSMYNNYRQNNQSA